MATTQIHSIDGPMFMPLLHKLVVRLGGAQETMTVGDYRQWSKHGQFHVEHTSERFARIKHTTLDGRVRFINLEAGWTTISNGVWRFMECNYDSFVVNALVERILAVAQPELHKYALTKIEFGMRCPRVTLDQLHGRLGLGFSIPQNRFVAATVGISSFTVYDILPTSGQSESVAHNAARAYRDPEGKRFAVIFKGDGRAQAVYFEGVRLI